MKKTERMKVSEATCWFLENKDVSIGVDRSSGLIRAARYKARDVDLFAIDRQNMEGHAAYVRVYDERDGKWYGGLAAPGRLVKAVKKDNTLTLTRSFPGAPFVLTETLQMDDFGLTWTLGASKVNQETADRSLRVGFNFPLQPSWRVWAPCLNGDFVFDGLDSFNFNHVQITFVSPREIILPVVSHYSKELDVGYTLLEPIGDAVPAARFQYENGEKLFNWGYNRKPVEKSPTLEALNYYIGLVGDRPMTTRVQIVFHEGDWRPGLGRVYRQYQPYFDPDEPGMYDMEGAFMCGGVWIGENIQPWLDCGLKTLEVHGHFRYYCDYFNDGQERWLKIGVIETVRRKLGKLEKREIDGQQVLEWLNTHTPEQIADVYFDPGWRARGVDIEKELFHTRANIKAMLTKMDAAGIRCFWYFNYTDGFRPIVEKRWPDAICRDQDGNPMPSGWHMCHNMNSDLSTSFGQFGVDSIGKIVREYPQLSGFFLDCFRHYEIDYAHNDGITVVDNRPAYSVQFSYDGITAKMREIMRATGKPMGIFANKPQTLRCMRHVDGTLLEGGGDQAEEKYFWAAIAKPLWFMWTSTEGSVDENLRRTLIYGCYPVISASGQDPSGVRALYQKYLPLYARFSRRVLCFEPDPMRIPRGARGKLYTLPGGDYIAGIATPAIGSEDEVKHAKAPYALFRVKRGHDVGKAGVMYPGDHDWRYVDFKFNGSLIAVPMAGYSNAAVVRLFVTGDSGKAIGSEKFTGPIDHCGDPESSFHDISKR